MLQPKQTKFRKMHKGRNRGLAQNGNTVAFGRFGLVASDRGRITARQIEAARRAMTTLYISIGLKTKYIFLLAKLLLRSCFHLFF